MISTAVLDVCRHGCPLNEENPPLFAGGFTSEDVTLNEKKGRRYSAVPFKSKGVRFLRERKALNFLKKTVKAPNPDVAKIQTSLGKNLIAQKRFGEAKELLTSALETSLKTKGEDHPDTKECRELLSKIQKRTFALRSESRL